MAEDFLIHDPPVDPADAEAWTRYLRGGAVAGYSDLEEPWDDLDVDVDGELEGVTRLDEPVKRGNHLVVGLHADSDQPVIANADGDEALLEWVQDFFVFDEEEEEEIWGDVYELRD